MTTVLITGANRGLGLEFCRQYLADGATVYAFCRSHSDGLDVLRCDDLRIVQTDMTDDAALADAIASLGDANLDVVINNAGTMGDSTFAESGLTMQAFGSFDRDEWHRVFDINVCTPMSVAELCAGRMNDGGRVVTITSMLASMQLNTVGGLYAYRASKAAVNSIMKSMGIDLMKQGIIAIAMHPGWVQTEMGGDNADIDTGASVAGMRRVIDAATIKDTGRFLAYDGSELPY